MLTVKRDFQLDSIQSGAMLGNGKTGVTIWGCGNQLNISLGCAAQSYAMFCRHDKNSFTLGFVRGITDLEKASEKLQDFETVQTFSKKSCRNTGMTHPRFRASDRFMTTGIIFLPFIPIPKAKSCRWTAAWERSLQSRISSASAATAFSASFSASENGSKILHFRGCLRPAVCRSALGSKKNGTIRLTAEASRHAVLRIQTRTSPVFERRMTAGEKLDLVQLPETKNLSVV